MLTAAGLMVVEVNVPDRGTRHARGKSDAIDAYAAARAAASGRAYATPKSRTGTVEALRQLRVARASAVKARTQAMNQLIGLRVTAPASLRHTLTGLARTALVRACLPREGRGPDRPTGRPARAPPTSPAGHRLPPTDVWRRPTVLIPRPRRRIGRPRPHRPGPRYPLPPHRPDGTRSA